MWEIKRYDSGKREEWNVFVENARNSTFLFNRAYMDYHADRFADHSLMAYRNGRLMAILPSNVKDTTLYSHQGLTYGGWVFPSGGLDVGEVWTLWQEWLEYCKSAGIESIIYKPLPYIYTEMPSEEDRYMLFLSKANPICTNISTAIDLEANPGFNKLQKRHLKKAENAVEVREITIADTKGVKDFYEMLRACLAERHGETPVHSFDELTKLMGAFPENIIIYGSYGEASDEILAGICVYETGICSHCQYIATTAEGREINALTPLVNTLIDYYEENGVRYFDFGISNEENGRALNIGLNRQKTSFGGSGVAYPCYEINVTCALASIPNEPWPGHTPQP